MSIKNYLSKINEFAKDKRQAKWQHALDEKITVFNALREKPRSMYEYFQNKVRTEELKAWYSCPDPGDLFQGTSVSSLVIPAEFKQPVIFKAMAQLEEMIADSYIQYHDQYAPAVREAIVEDVYHWVKEGLFYGIVLPSKVISQVFNLTVQTDALVVDVDGKAIDPHEITSYDPALRNKYFEKVRPNIECFKDMAIERHEFESSLVLADVSKPRIEKYKGKALLGPVRCNEIAALMARNIRKLIAEKSKNQIAPRSFEVVIYDTDTPYTYHHVMGWNGDSDAPCLPGLTVLGASGSINAFKWLYAYRVSLVAQKLMKGSLCSQHRACFIPYIFMGVLVPRDAEILLDMNELDLLRYKGNISPKIEFACLADELLKYVQRKA